MGRYLDVSLSEVPRGLCAGSDKGYETWARKYDKIICL